VATGQTPPEPIAPGSDELFAKKRDLPAYRFGDGHDGAWVGSIGPVVLPACLFALAKRHATGLLVARHGEREKRVYLNDGLPVFIASTDPSELLGARLERAGVVTQEQVEHCVEHALRNGGRLGEALVDVARVRPVVVLRSLLAQIEDRFTELGAWRDGELIFMPDVRHAERTLPPHFSPEALVVRAIRRGYSEAELAQLIEPASECKLTMAGDASALYRLGLTSAEQRAFAEIERGGSWIEIAERVGHAIPRIDFLRALFVGLSYGVLIVDGEELAA
jgi:hypothetical protein